MTTALDEYNERRALEKKRKAGGGGKKGPIPPSVRAKKVDGKGCRCCGISRIPVEAHHLVPRSKFIGERLSGRVHDPDNIIPLCHPCHTGHHTTAHRRVPREVLTEAEAAFVFEQTSESWFDKWYPESKQGAA